MLFAKDHACTKPITKIALKPMTNNFIQIVIRPRNIVATLYFDSQKV